MALSHDGRFLIVVDVDGHALFINFPRKVYYIYHLVNYSLIHSFIQVILQRMNFKKKVYDIKFSPDDTHFAVTYGNGCQIWKTPSIQREFAPLILSRTLSGLHDASCCLDWSSDSNSLIIGSKDLTAKIFYRIKSKHMASTVLTGHRDKVVSAFFGSDDDTAYTVASDGAVFTWQFEYGDRVPITKKKKYNDEMDDEDEVEDDEEEEDEEDETVKTKRGGKWVLASREFLWDPHSRVISAAFNKVNGLLVVGFNTGVFGLYSMPGCTNIHKLSVSHHSLNTISINSTGEWIAVGSSRLGQLLVWEWQSESYVLKQQGKSRPYQLTYSLTHSYFTGHLYGLNCLDISSDGQYVATGGDDSKVKLWNASSGFCFVTFTEHLAPITGVKFAGKGAGKAIISSSLDGTIRAHDLLRYKNFRTLTAPTPVQFTSLSVDNAGEIVCAGSLEPFNVYVWSLQTGRLLDILAGHEGPIACMEFSVGTSTLATGSWDGTLKLWDIYQNKCVETFEHGCDVLALAFRPDGKEVCTCATNGNIYFWDVDSGEQLGFIEGKRDISGGRFTTDARTADNSTRSKHFTCVTYSADGTCILAAGHSKYACIYAIASKTLVKKFQLSHNRSLEGVLDELRSDRIVDGLALDNIAIDDSDDEHGAKSTLPGTTMAKKTDGSRLTRPDIITSALKFSPTGREWIAATTQGLQVFSLDDAMLFAPTDLDITITPQTIIKTVQRQEYSLAVNMALHLGEQVILKKTVDSVPIDAVELVVQSIDVRMLRDLLKLLATEFVLSKHIEYYLRWCWCIINAHGKVLSADSMPYRESLRGLVRTIGTHEKEIMHACDENNYNLIFLASQLQAITSTFVQAENSDSMVGVEVTGESEESDDAADEVAVDTTKIMKKKSIAVKANKNVKKIKEIKKAGIK
jgi:periodic tryptophan protein 2